MYTLERFGSIMLPIYDPESDLSPVEPRLALIETTGGAFDNDGGSRSAQKFPHPLAYQGTLVISDSTLTAVRTTVDALRAAVGTRATLYRRAWDDDTVQTCVARLAKMPVIQRYGDVGQWKISLNFLQMGRWRGARHDDPWTFDSGEFFDEGLIFDEEAPTVLDTNPKTTVVVNNGNLPVRDAQVIVTAQGTDITAITFSATGISLTWTGALSAGASLIIDDADVTVLAAGLAAYDDLTRNVGHVFDTWFEFAPGATSLTINRTGGDNSSTIAIIFRDGWA
jgi:hypothetical protein